MSTFVLASPAADLRARDALARALERAGATLEFVDAAERLDRLRSLAADPACDWIIVADADVVPFADAFASLRRTFAAQPGIVGGRALVGVTQRFGGMFAPARSGPNPFELAPIIGLQTERGLSELVRGPVDYPQRGLIAVAAAFVRAIGTAPLDPHVLAVDLAVLARAAGIAVVCEPAISFYADEDSVDVVRSRLDLRRYAPALAWDPDAMHREPVRLRSQIIDRETRVMGNYRGFQKRPYPPIDVLVVGPAAVRATVARAAAALAVGGSVTGCDDADGAFVRRAFGRTGDRYLLVTDARALPARADVERLAERLERSDRIAIALDQIERPYRTALVHGGRMLGAAALDGDGVDTIVAAAIAALPALRLYAAAPGGPIVPPVLPARPAAATLDVILVAAAQPTATNQTIQALLQDPSETRTVVFPAGSHTIRTLCASMPELRLEPDEVDPTLAVGVNRALAACRSDLIAIVRDDVQLTRGLLGRMRAAFERLPRLGAAVPRVGGAERPEGVPEIGYANVMEMKATAERRARLFAREATLVDVATIPVIVVRRAALEVVGGFDEAFGFSRYGIEDFTRRLRSANYQVVRCEDGYAHVFPPDQAVSFLVPIDESAVLRARYEQRWAVPRGFDAERDRVALRDRPVGTAIAPTDRLRVLVAIADEAEWARVAPLIGTFAATFRSSDPVDLAIGLDGTLSVQAAVAGLRDLFAASTVPLEETLNVLVDRIGDVAAWRDAHPWRARLAGVERAELDAVEAVGSVADVRGRWEAMLA